MTLRSHSTEPYYLYRHVRLDKNEPFYIGIGKKVHDAVEHRVIHNRAYSKNDRSDFWGSIVAKTEYDVEIMFESDSKDAIRAKETEFIKLYGRRDLGTGVLCNMTDGGDNGLNVSKHASEKRIATAKRNGTYAIMIERIKKYSVKKGQIGSTCDKKVFVYKVEDGSFLKEYSSREQCSKALLGKNSETTVCSCINKRKSIKGYIFSNFYLGEEANIDAFDIRREIAFPVMQTRVDWSVVKKFPTIKSASDETGIATWKIINAINRKSTAGGFYWEPQKEVI